MENNICTSWYSNVAIENEKKQTSHLKEADLGFLAEKLQ